MAKAIKKRATFDQLVNKKPREKTMTLVIDDEELEIVFKALPPKVYDDLLAAHPPTKAQKEKGEIFNPETFPPVIMAACMIEPTLSVEEAAEIWESGAWSKGELLDILIQVVNLNMRGLDVPFTEGG